MAKLQNYNHGYIPFFDCSIHGKITLNSEEWQDIRTNLPRAWRSFSRSYPRTVQLFKKDCERLLPNAKDKTILLNVRVPATTWIVKRLGLKGYKAGNYMLNIKG